jgi:hypothetical protein
MQMKILAHSLLLSTALLAQTPDNTRIVTYNRADTAHCKVIVVNGKPLLESTYNGTSVAVGLFQNWGNGEFSVLVSIAQVGPEAIEVNPKGIFALYSDAAHTRLTWFDKGRELDTEASIRASGLSQPGGGGPSESGPIGDSSAATPAPTHPEAMRDLTTNPGTRSEEEARQIQLRQTASGSRPQQVDPAHPPVFLRHTTLKPGSRTFGQVFVRKPRGKLAAAPTGILDEIDIPLNGIIFRF